MKHAKTLFFRVAPAAAALALMAAGCVAYDPEPQRPAASQDEVNYLRGEIQQQRQHIAQLEQQIDQLNGTLAQERWQRDSSAGQYASSAQTAALQQQIADLQKQVKALDAARATDRAQIYDDITKKITDLLKTMGGGGSSGSRSGIQHVVRPGESLSKIAAAYGVPMAVIVKENNITNPANIRVGQTLFIPDP